MAYKREFKRVFEDVTDLISLSVSMKSVMESNCKC